MTRSYRQKSFGPAFLAGLLLVGVAAHRANAQAPGPPVAVPVGKGSYASFPPPDTGKGVADVLDKPLFVDNPSNKPLPTNQWWTDLLVDRRASSAGRPGRSR